MLLTVVSGIIGLGIVVFVHELGHFAAAKLSGITVEAFSLAGSKRSCGKVERHRVQAFTFACG